MQILVLGGTAWLGHEIAAEALRRGHQVTCLARGTSGAVPSGARLVRADRDATDGLDAVAGQHWDAVLDVSRQPGQVRQAAAALAGAAKHFTFVSSCSVYADHDSPGADESAGLLPPLESDVMTSPDVYGQAKVACENAARDAFGPGRTLIVRPGLIAGPGDITDRTGYWPLRFARPVSDDGAVLVPNAPGLDAQVIDARDLAAWLVASAGKRLTGEFNAVGDVLGLAEHLEVARSVAGHSGPVMALDQEELAAADVNPWAGQRSLPLWLPLTDFAGFTSRSNAAAKAAGLALRPLAETLADTLDWELAAGPDRPRNAGLASEEERRLLTIAHARS
ncbi:NAD-dependent epimerase/dehydratase family protein [Arthrobacter sp. CAU 1506]|uniref:NAD-dependent epimerase/dehydratase family protein n=1 Tax=Arthrobacter sp. CAU 1506 TaxID=2560052 RepID=UPI0010AB86CB|nr:NAD-dependent epimerase/dehydratase family protein [Arthrobacter sp. CAU 1506]TJY72529.1 NAD-dependent epimerase/dehydratase family protein [Arthrobacter sp. CAU 1506]